MYIAMKYIGRDYTPGDILPDDLPTEQVEWLKEAGAILDTAPFPRRKDLEETESPPGTVETTAAEDVKPAAEEEAAEAAEAEEMEPEAPVIDAMDGIVSEHQEPEKPKKKRGKKH